MARVNITSQGTRVVSIKDLTESSTVKRTLKIAESEFPGLRAPRKAYCRESEFPGLRAPRKAYCRERARKAYCRYS